MEESDNIGIGRELAGSKPFLMSEVRGEDRRKEEGGRGLKGGKGWHFVCGPHWRALAHKEAHNVEERTHGCQDENVRARATASTR